MTFAVFSAIIPIDSRRIKLHIIKGKKMKRSFLFIPLLLLLLLSGCGNQACTHPITSEEVVPASCDQEGYILHQCTDCDFSYRTEIVPPAGHSLTKVITPSTCTTEGHTTYSCACGYSYVSDPVAPTGHQNTETVIAATCTAGGYTQQVCSVCHLTVQTNMTDAKGHLFTDTVISPTCSEVGYTVKSCSVCAFSYRSDYINPTGHAFAVTVTHPTRRQFGNFTYTCSCGYQTVETLFYSDVFPGAHVTENSTVLAKGVDVSLNQNKLGSEGERLPLNWTAIQNAGFDFAILKAGSTPRGEGAGGKEEAFEMNYRDAKAAGMPVGAYFYTYATTPEQVKEDAELLITWLAGKQFEYPIYFDLEDSTLAALGKDVLTEFCTIFISTLQENGYYGALYINDNWLKEKLHGDSLKEIYDIWYARPPIKGSDPISSDTSYTWGESYGPQLGMWQYSHHGVIEGCPDVEFDFNYVYRDYPSIIKKYGYNGFTVTSEL